MASNYRTHNPSLNPRRLLYSLHSTYFGKLRPLDDDTSKRRHRLLRCNVKSMKRLISSEACPAKWDTFTFFSVAMILSVCDKEGLDGDTTSWEKTIVASRRREGKVGEWRGRKGERWKWWKDSGDRYENSYSNKDSPTGRETLMDNSGTGRAPSTYQTYLSFRRNAEVFNFE